MNDQNTLLVIDVGNTNIHWSFVKGSKLGEYNRNRHTELSLLPWDEVKQNNYSVVVAGALSHINESVETIANDYKVKLTEVTIDKQSIIKNTYPTLGIDRVCNLAASLKSLPALKSPVVVFDFGTATTITACDQNSNFLGGMITTGCEIELKAMSSRTLSLPHVELAKEQKITKLDPLARTSEDAILNGVIISQVSLIDYYLNLFKEKTSTTPKIVFTGGNAPIISRFIKLKPDLYDPHLTIKGIVECYNSCLVKK